jgi:hypothetical protein
VLRRLLLGLVVLSGDKKYVLGTGSAWWRLPEEWASETGKLLVQLTVQRGC